MPVPLIAVAGYATTALVTAAIAALKAGRCVVPRVAEWDEPPLIWLHPDLDHLAGPLCEAVVRWGDLGHDMTPGSGMVHPDPGEAAVGWVRILPRPLDRVRAATLASAVVTADFADDPDEIRPPVPEDDHEVDAPEGVIRRAVIYVDPVDLSGKDAARVLAHELGHALGYLHCTARLGRKHAAHRDVVVQVPKHGHLMHPRYAEGGWGTEGLEAEALGDPRERRRARREARR